MEPQGAGSPLTLRRTHPDEPLPNAPRQCRIVTRESNPRRQTGSDQRREGAVHLDGSASERAQGAGDVIVSSPLKRSLQTAQLVGTELGYDARVEISAALEPDADYTDFQQMLAHYSGYEGVLAVGHNPNVFQFLGRLVTGNGGAAIRMRKGSVARVDLDRHPPLLQWLIDPRMARAIYASVQKSSRPKTSRK